MWGLWSPAKPQGASVVSFHHQGQVALRTFPGAASPFPKVTIWKLAKDQKEGQ